MNSEPKENVMNRTAEMNRTAHRQSGLSLVEIMVALAVGVVLLTGVIQIYASTKSTYRMQDSLARLQENGRFALSFLTRDVRMAGYHGCTNFGPITNTLNNPGSLQYDFSVGLTGFNDVGASPPALLSGAGIVPIAGSDVVVVRRNSDEPVRVVKNNSSAQLFVETLSQVPGGCADGTDKVSGLCATDILMVSDCIKSRVFQAGNLQVTGTPPDLNITHPASGTPGNAVSRGAAPAHRTKNSSAMTRKLSASAPTPTSSVTRSSTVRPCRC